MIFHKHRLVPGHVGGTYDPTNVIRVNIAMHAFLHEQLFLEHGRQQDKIAADALRGHISKQEIALRLMRMPKSIETRRKMSEFAKTRTYSAETRAKISVAHKGRPSCMLGKKHSAETRMKMSIKAKARDPKKASLNFKVGVIPHPRGMAGKTHSEETRQKMRDSRAAFLLLRKAG